MEKPKFKKSVGVQGRSLHPQAHEVIANVIKFMKAEAAADRPLIPLKNYKQRVQEATGVKERTYRKITKQIGEIEMGARASFDQQEPLKVLAPELILLQDVKEEAATVKIEEVFFMDSQ